MLILCFTRNILHKFFVPYSIPRLVVGHLTCPLSSTVDAIKFGVHRLIDSEDEEHGNAILRAIRINSEPKQIPLPTEMRPQNQLNRTTAAPYLSPPSPGIRISRSKSRSPHDDLRSRSRSSSSELEVDSPPHSPSRPVHPPSVSSPSSGVDLGRLHGSTTLGEMGQMGRRSELFSVTNLLRDDLPKVQKNPFGVTMFRPQVDVLRWVERPGDPMRTDTNDPLIPRPPYAAFYEQGFPRPWLPFPWIAAALQNQNPGGALR